MHAPNGCFCSVRVQGFPQNLGFWYKKRQTSKILLDDQLRKTLQVIPHTSSSLCKKAENTKEKKNPCSLSLFPSFKQPADEEKHWGLLPLSALQHCMSAVKVQERRWGEAGRREGGRDAKKKKNGGEGQGIPSIPVLFSPGLQANSTRSSEIEPNKSLAELIQSIWAQNSPALPGKSQRGTRVGSPIKSPSPVWLNPVRLG